MKKRIVGTILGFIFLAISALIVAFVDLELIFLVPIFLGCAGMLMIAWGGMYFERSFPLRRVKNDKGKCKDVCSDLFHEAKKSIRIVGGNLHHGFYSDNKIVKDLKEALQRGVNVEIVCGPKIDAQNDKLLNLAQTAEHFKIIHLPYYPQRHFMVVDGRHVRKEKKHSTNLTQHLDVEGDILYNRPFLASQLSEIFETLKHKAQLRPQKI